MGTSAARVIGLCVLAAMWGQMAAAGEPAGQGRRAAFAGLPVRAVEVDAAAAEGPLEGWRHSVGHGGINAEPLPEGVVEGIGALRPRMIRIFIQEFFFIYSERGRFDWSRLDPYMEALGKTGAKIMAAITIKPKAIYPKIDQRVWRPADEKEWQRVVGALVQRYGVEKKLVTHWEVGNETDIGEDGGCPWLIPDAKEYADYYAMTIAPILSADAKARVGGTAVANAGGPQLPGFIEQCRAHRLPMDFISWHLYSDDPGSHAGLVEKYRKLLEGFPGKRPEMYVTEWSKGFDPVSLEEMAFDPRRAAATAATLVAMMRTKVDGTFYYHLWDQVAYGEDFSRFFERPAIMYHHWNEVPHRFGLFGVGGEARPQYFVFQMLRRMEGQRVACRTAERDLWVVGTRSGGSVNVMVANYGLGGSTDKVASVRFAGLKAGKKMLRTWRIDDRRAWGGKPVELRILEQRAVDTTERFECQVYCPGDSVIRVELEEAGA